MNRNIIQKKNILLGLTFKSLGMILNFLLIPFLITFLGKIEYGVWITVFSVTNWIFTFDIGIGHGLRNKLTEAISLNDIIKANKIVCTSYVLISLFAGIILIIGVVLILSLDFQTILNYSRKSNEYLQLFIFFSLLFTVLNFVLSLYKKLYLAIHESFVIELVNTSFLLFYLLFVFIFIKFNIFKSLIGLIIIYGTVNMIFALLATMIFFKIKKKIVLSFKFFDSKEGKSLFNLGGKFFVINISLLIILSTDNVIVSNILGPGYVTDYSIVQKLFQFIIVGFSVILASSWSLYSDALVRKDYNWIRRNIRKMNLLFIGIVFIGFLLYFFIDPILDTWIGKEVIILPKGLVFYNMIYCLIFCFSNIYMYFINATGQIKVQMYLYLFGALVNIPLSIYLVNLLETSTGVILSTIISTLPVLLGMPIQAKLILRNFEANNII
ncbi:O-antigen export protein [Yeosuana aromativorans]|uniref:O-antigen export protein n=1 Tax=Yeosuana aromativorans TaxID=288019 RepID=A0A8J3BLQ4_9FLAO|nr:MATE family efflux transporter [Yeosuana aromativorans]GGK30646.1 O-antigen export protein [Yeosuana aromativorans]